VDIWQLKKFIPPGGKTAFCMAPGARINQMQTLPAQGCDVRVERCVVDARVEAANEPPFSHFTAWSIVCALEEYIYCYADFRRLQGGGLVLSRKKGEEM
jgi:hypothetical protein